MLHLRLLPEEADKLLRQDRDIGMHLKGDILLRRRGVSDLLADIIRTELALDLAAAIHRVTPAECTLILVFR